MEWPRDASSSSDSERGIQFDDRPPIDRHQVHTLYRENAWSSAGKLDDLMNALANSHSVVTAWNGRVLVGLGNAISDGCLVVYYPHLLVLPSYRRRGIGQEIMQRLLQRYEGFHQHALLADGRAVGFYEQMGFRRAGATEPMWIYEGNDH